LAAKFAASHTEPSYISPSPKIQKNLFGKFSKYFAEYANPQATPSP